MLCLAYHFPPVGGAGVQRTLKFVRYLPRFDYEPIVLTGPGNPVGRWTPTDETLVDELPDEATVVRVEQPEPPPATAGRARIERWLQLESPFARWWQTGIVAGGARIRDVDLVYASMSPFETGPAAAEVAATLDVPLVADFRDPWALDEMTVYPTALHRRRELGRMRGVLTAAGAVVMNTPEAVRAVVDAFPELRVKRVVSIPNGYDEDDFGRPPPTRSDGAFRIVHAGYLHTQLGHETRARSGLRRRLGGAEPVDIMTRSHVVLLEALERLIAADPSLADLIELHFAGVLSESDRRALDHRRFRAQCHGYLPHRAVLELIRSADLLFLPMHDLPRGCRARVVPGKTYEYLAAGRPILAALPDGDARDLLESIPTARVCRPDDVDGLAAATMLEVHRFSSEGRAPTVVASPALAFERQALTAKLAALFDRTLGGRNGIPEPSQLAR